MTCPQEAARLSEDIGDVLSAIRRLIAEDEAQDFARDRLLRQQSAVEEPRKDAGEDLAERFGGNAALARQLVRDGRAAADRAGAAPAGPNFIEHPLTAPRPRLIADLQVPPARAVHAELVARRDPPLRHESGESSAAGALPPLRLDRADRVDSRLVADQGSGDQAAEIWPDDFADFYKVGPDPIPSDPIPATFTQRTEDDDFAEAFEAKSRMRPEVLMPVRGGAAADDATPVAEAEAPETEAGEHAEVIGTETGPTDFWAAYLQIGDEVAMHREVEEVTPPIDHGDDAAIAAAGWTGMAIPSCISPDPFAEDLDDPASASTEAEADQPADGSKNPVATPPDEVETVRASGPDYIPGSGPSALPTDDDQLRDLIREMIQEELHGELGQRFSRNLRAVIRREVAAAIDEHLERI
ncbi:hypothetical protein CX676_15535 [Paracoccus zhejiangensis]|uniref:DUF2497 domain-containing protein n=2 Tax=Paracoccus zhejiangensis TaxID=1077935 RepID=A0A2H5F1I7_9RHOB|nr:hypothetical protein CX676_15535 [Paracoccus zhejiangensis]